MVYHSEIVTLLRKILDEAPVDFLGTGSNSKAADKEEKEWRDEIENMIKRLESES